MCFRNYELIAMQNNKKNVSYRKTSHFINLIIIGALLQLTGCKQDIPDEGFVPGIPWLVGSTMIPLKPFGYEKAEYFIQGTAQSYETAQPRSEDGKWDVEVLDEAEFRTRMVVYRPIDPADFNGTVIMEWLNVSGGTEASSEWIMAHTELLRSGYVWIGVSAQKSGIDGAGVTVLPLDLSLKTIKPSRYGTLIHPGDQYAYDIFSQVGLSVTQPQNFNPLGDLVAERVIASGESQSADFMVTYINAIAPRDQVFDGYYIHSRVHGSAPLQPDPELRELGFEVRDTVFVRDDLDVPVMMLQTETDSTILGAYLDAQPDTDLFRVWEVAGTAHADRYVGNIGLTDRGTNPQVAAVIESRYPVPVIKKCGKPVNSGPQHFVVKASLNALDQWLRTGMAPTSADRFQFDEDTASFVRDEYGNVLGGIRTPYVDVPIATLSGEGQSEDDLFCSLYGTTDLFDEETLASLYPDHETYVSMVSDSVDEAVAKGHLLAPDGDLIKAWAQQSQIGVQEQ